MGLLDTTREAVRVLREMREILPILRQKIPTDEDMGSLGVLFEDSVARNPDNTLLLFEGREWTYAEFNAEVNQLSHLLAQRGIERGDCVALFMENRAEFLLAVLAIAKLGAAAALINNSLTGDGLVHCIKATDAKACIVGEERADVMAGVLDDLPLQAGRDLLWCRDRGEATAPAWSVDIAPLLADMPADNLPVTRDIRAGETALYIFTSGTTGLPKAAIMVHRKLLLIGNALGPAGFKLKPSDRLYLCLPTYHLTGFGPGFCCFIAGGASIFLRRQFSASRFWSEVQEYRTNCFVYVGELCRYLLAQPAQPEERANPLEKMVGNGLRPDVWDEFQQRFGVARICEIYGSSEGNVTFVNLLNKPRTIGASFTPVALVKYDTEADEIVRDASGRCEEVAVGEPGLLLAEITPDTQFEGYTNKEATASKIVRNVKADGDAWFNTGDLVRRIDVGFSLGLKHYQFVDRTGDTFRWRSENVSTNEVAEVINRHPQINMANVYGVEVPATEGKAGMVAFEMARGDELDLEALKALVEGALPPYAHPVFVRVLRSTSTTQTFKLVKGELRAQAFHPDQVGDDTIYVRKPGSAAYERLDRDFYQQLLGGTAGY